MDLNVICRICLCDGDMRPLDTEINGHSYKDKILQCTNIQLKIHSNFPEQICNKCVDDLETAYIFRLNCESSDAILMSFIESQESLQLKQESEADLESDRGDPEFDDDKSSQQKVISEIEFLDNLTCDIVSEEYLNDHELTQYTQETVPDHIELITELPMDEASNTATSDVIVISNFPSKPAKNPRQKGRQNKHSTYTDEDQNVCELCGKSYKQKYSLEVHMRRHQNVKPYKCDQCELSFVIPFELKRHQRTHTGDKPYACQHCGRKFSDFGSRIKHERTHTGERPYQCSQCPKSFAYSHVLNSHRLVHTGEKNYACPICDKRFAKAHHLKSHRNVHLKEHEALLKRHLPSEDVKSTDFFVIEDHQEDLDPTENEHREARYMEIFENTNTSHQVLLSGSPKSLVSSKLK